MCELTPEMELNVRPYVVIGNNGKATVKAADNARACSIARKEQGIHGIYSCRLYRPSRLKPERSK